MEKNPLKKWMDKNIKDTEGLPKTRAELDTLMREGFPAVDALSVAELETFIQNGKNKFYIASYANCLLKARQTGNYKEVNRQRHMIGMNNLP
jgi:hypothetical protein